MTSENSTIDSNLLNSLLQFDESLRSRGQIKTCGIPVDADLQENLELGQAAILELEAAIPRHISVMPSWAPETIGRFRIQSVLGSGGFAVVYLAFDPALNRNVALKIPRPHALIKAELRRRFVTEAQAAAKLDHPNIVPVYEAGEDRDLPYIACAYCDGPTLAEWMSSRTGPVKARIAAEIVRDLANAVHFSHERGILHRDIKPGNVLLFPDASRAAEEFRFIPRLSDFGLAKVLESGELDTVTSQLLGTPRFMAPEVIQGRGRPDALTPDIYALGALLYCLIAGRPPFGSATAAETIRQISDDEPVPPQTLDPSIGRDLSLVCMKCLQKNPEARYQTALDLVADLERYLAGRPVFASPTPPAVRLQKWCRRRPGVASLLGVTLILTMALIVFAIHYTTSLRTLQANLSVTNDELSRHVEELNRAIDTSNKHEEEADKNRRIADEQVFAADLKLAESLIRSGDIFGAQGVLLRYRGADSDSQKAGPTEIDGPESFSWRYLMRQTTRSGIPPQSSGQIIWDSQLSPDQSKLAVTGNRGIIRIMDPANGLQTIVEKKIAETEFNSLSWCDTRPILAVAGDDGTIRICHTADLTLERTLEVSPGKRLFSMSFQPETTNLFVNVGSATLQVWDAETGQKTGEFTTPHTEEIEHLAVAPDASCLVTGSWDYDGKVCCQDIQTGSVLWEQTISGIPSGFISIVRFTPDQKYVVVAARKKSVIVLDSKTGAILRRWDGLDRIHALAVDNSRVVCGNELGLLTELSLEDTAPHWRPLRQWQGHSTKISSIVRLPEPIEQRHRIDVVSFDRAELQAHWLTGRTVAPDIFSYSGEHQFHTERASLQWKNNQMIYRLSPDHIESLDLANHRTLRFSPSDRDLTCMKYCEALKQIFCSDQTGRVFILDEAGKTIDEIRVFDNLACDLLSIDDSGTLLITRSSNTADLCVIDLTNKTIRLRLPNREYICLSPDGRWLASGSQQLDCYEIYSISTFEKVAVLHDVDPTYETCLFSPDSKHLVSAGSRRQVIVWNCDDWKLSQRFAVSTSSMRLPCFHPDSRTLAVAGDEGSIRLVDIIAGRELVEISSNHSPETSGLGFSPDGNQLAIAAGNLDLYVISNPDEKF
ncbi:MAG: serine/threonine-protein kinase [Planctomycetaceae bacterium]